MFKATDCKGFVFQNVIISFGSFRKVLSIRAPWLRAFVTDDWRLRDCMTDVADGLCEGCGDVTDACVPAIRHASCRVYWGPRCMGYIYIKLIYQTLPSVL